MSFNIEQKVEGPKAKIMLKGNIDEDASFAGSDLSNVSDITLDLQEVKAINSCGIREWINWIRTAPAGAQITFENCPKIIVDQINMVAGFLPEKAKVRSFYVPYYCDSSGNEKMVLFREGQEFKGSDIFAPEEVKDDETGEFMEMDVIEAKYFKFLNR
jgi:hypothetical protein